MSKKSIFLYTLGGILLFLVIVIRNMPAVFVLGHAAKATGAFSSYNTTGTIWQGESRLIVNAGRNRVDLGAVQWNITGWSLLIGQLDLTLNADQPSQRLSGDFNLNLLNQHLTASGVEGGFDLALVQQFVAIPGKISGMVDINIPNLSASIPAQQLTDLQGNVVVKDLAVNFAGPVELGTFGAKLSLADNADSEEMIVVADLSDIDATIALNGRADALASNQSYYLDVNIEPKANANKMLVNTLKQFYRPQSDGSYNVKFGKPLR
ncbi:Uncharacterised protein [BD1-7 clade bacterium]|uniref:Type II secretion system protein N n=1 Tax=BD1-7 clade bacterium TaxID=2029982 RepID=A0A5S9PP00_9GAMM|nr:Uncharacterised protein [BD1-7 clade bacterium]